MRISDWSSDVCSSDLIQARVAYTYRDDFLQVAVGRNSEQEYFNGYGQLDASLSYDLTDTFTVFVDGLNLTNSKEFLYSMTPDRSEERSVGKEGVRKSKSLL